MTDRTQVPDGWRLARLGDVAEVITGSTPPREVNEYFGGQVPWVKPSDLAGGRLVDTSTEYLSKAGVLVSRLVPKDTVLVSCIGTIGETAIASIPLCFNQQINSLIPRDEAIPAFLYWACDHRANYLRAIASKTAVPILNKSAFSAVSILLPPLAEQRAIAAVLDSIDDAIVRTEEAIAATERLRDSLLHWLLTRGVPGQHSEWKEAPGIGTIPACWDVVRLGDVAEVQTGRAVNRKAIRTEGLEVPYLSVANVKDGYLDLSIVKNMLVLVDEIDRYKLRDDDVLFTEGGDADKLGRGAVWRNEIALCLHQNHVFAVRPRQGVLTSDFLASFAASRYGKRYFLSAAKQTTNLASVNASQLKLMPMPLPTPQEQLTIVAALDGVDEAIERARMETDMLKSLKAAAADALLTGRVRVEMGERIHDQ